MYLLRWGTIITFFARGNFAERSCISKIECFRLDGAVRCDRSEQSTPFLNGCTPIQGIRASCEFEEFFQFFGNGQAIGLVGGESVFERSPVLKQGRFSFLEQVPLHCLIEICVGQSAQSFRHLLDFDSQSLQVLLAVCDPGFLQLRDALLEELPLVCSEFQPLQLLRCKGGDRILTNGSCWACLCMAAVVDIALLKFSNERVPATAALHESAIQEIMHFGAGPNAPVEDVLNAIKGPLRDQGFMVPNKCLVCGTDTDYARVEGVSENRVQTRLSHSPSGMIAQSATIEFVSEGGNAPLPRGIQFKSLADERPFLGINRLCLRRSIVQISNRRSQRIKSLLQASVDALLGFLAEVADEIRGDHCLDVGGEPATSRMKVERFVGKVHFDALIDQFAEVCPVSKIARASIYLVDDDTCRLSLAQEAQHCVPYGSAFFRCRLQLLEGLSDLKVVPSGISADCVFLLR